MKTSVRMDLGSLVLISVSPCRCLTSEHFDAMSWIDSKLEEPLELEGETFCEGIRYSGNREVPDRQYYKTWVADWQLWAQFPADALTVVLVKAWTDLSALSSSWDRAVEHIELVDEDFNLRQYVKVVMAARCEDEPIIW